MRVLALSVVVVAAAVGCDAPENPPVRAEPEWPSAQVEELARRACFDCHSNETKWPPYTSWPLVGDLVKNDVAEAREAINFSEWDREQKELDDLGEVVREGEMPLGIYVPFHPDSWLSDEEKAILADGLDQLAGTRERDDD